MVEVGKAQKDQIYSLAMELAEEEQFTGILCPFCNGGSSKEKTFNLKRQRGWALYKCHRASCGAEGRQIVSMLAIEHKQESPPEINRFRKEIENLKPLPDEIVEIFKSKYYFNNTDFTRLDAKWASTMRRVAIPIQTLDYMKLGYTMRSFDKEVKPKTYNVITDFNRPVQSWYRNWAEGIKRVVIVEDQISAVRAVNVASSIALLGTNINLLGIKDIADKDPEHVLFCLDGDAFKVGLALQRKWGGMFDKCTVAKPPKDLKDMEPQELRDFLGKQFGE